MANKELNFINYQLKTLDSVIRIRCIIQTKQTAL